MRIKMLLKGRVVNPGEAEGEALVLSKPISFLGDIDRSTGVITNPDLDAYGLSVADKVLVAPGGRGSTVGAWVIYGLKRRGRAPAAIVLGEGDTVIASGCIIADIPLVDNVRPEPHKVISSGDVVRVERDGLIRVFRRI